MDCLLPEDEQQDVCVFLLEIGSAFDDFTVRVDAFCSYEIAGKVDTDLFITNTEMFGSDFNDPETTKKMAMDSASFISIDMRKRMNERLYGPLQIRTKVGSGLTREDVEAYVSTMSTDELKQFIDRAKA